VDVVCHLHTSFTQIVLENSLSKIISYIMDPDPKYSDTLMDSLRVLNVLVNTYSVDIKKSKPFKELVTMEPLRERLEELVLGHPDLNCKIFWELAFAFSARKKF
jgi:hypothetical protein